MSKSFETLEDFLKLNAESFDLSSALMCIHDGEVIYYVNKTSRQYYNAIVPGDRIRDYVPKNLIPLVDNLVAQVMAGEVIQDISFQLRMRDKVIDGELSGSLLTFDKKYIIAKFNPDKLYWKEASQFVIKLLNSKQQIRILEVLALGVADRTVIARITGIKEKDVYTHLNRLYKKFEIAPMNPDPRLAELMRISKFIDWKNVGYKYEEGQKDKEKKKK